MDYDSIFNITSDKLMSFSPTCKSFHYSILKKYLASGVDNYENMMSLPISLRKALKKHYTNVYSSEVIDVKKDINSMKLLIKLYDDNYIECVILTDNENHHTACLSSEVGCAMKCEFCATGTIGFKRDLNYYEIIEQFFHLKKLVGKIDRIVYMGMGEPLCNMEGLTRSISYFKNECGMSARRITVSTSGLGEGIKELADHNLGVKLALSLVTADDEMRKKLMSAARINTLTDVKKALLYYQAKNSQRIALEYCLLKGVNMDANSVKKIKEFTKGLIYSLNLIPWNPIQKLPFKSPSDSEIKNFTNLLENNAIPYTIRVSKGQKTSSACGMLAAKHK